jgi:3-isopropylmalate dehydratase small subunit
MIMGRARLLGDNISGDHIIRSEHLNAGKPLVELLPYLFESCRQDLASTLRTGDILVAGHNFGCGSSREHGISLLKEIGISCVVAKSFARSAYRNCINLGLLPIICEVTAHEFDCVVIDALSGTLKVNKKTYAFPQYPEMIVNIIREGGLINYYIHHGHLL